MKSDNLSKLLASFTVDLETVPNEVSLKAKLCFLDGFGVMLRCTDSDCWKMFFDVIVSMGGRRETTIFGSNRKAPVVHAAFMNGVACRVLDYDDGVWSVRGHPGSVLVPTVLTLGEKVNAKGLEALLALVVGYETYIALGAAINPSHRIRGFDATGTCGTFASTAVAGRLLNLSPSELMNAFGIAGSFASGLNEWLADGSMTKVIHSGKAARDGVMAAIMAKKGVTGPHSVIEGRRGFLHSMGDQCDASPLFDLGKRFRISEVYLKLYPCVRRTHTAIDALFKAFGPKPPDPMAIERIQVNTSSYVAELGTITEPKTELEAQSSIPFCLALVASHGTIKIEDFYISNLQEKEILTLSRKVYVHVDEKFEKKSSDDSDVAAEVIVFLKTGEKLTGKVSFPRGDPKNPVDQEILYGKFKRVVKPIVKSATAERILKAVMNLEHLRSLRLLRDMVTSGVSYPSKKSD